MFKRDVNHYYIEEFRELGVEALYTGGDFPHWELEKDRKVVHGYQTHSKNVQIVRENLQYEEIPYPDCDGLITERKDIVLYTKHADCLAIYFYDREKEVIGICHSGWRGSYERIGIEVLENMRREYGSEPKDILVGIGIGIAPENYEVSQDFYETFQKRYSPKLLEEVFMREGERYLFHNERFNYNLLRDYGILEENIICSNLCTYSDKTLHSHRRDREKAGRNRAYIFFSEGR